MTRPSPCEVLPHGAGMRLLATSGELVDGWLEYPVRLSSEMSIVDERRLAPPELGLEMMAQACGMLVASESSGDSGGRRIGVVGAVRGYEYGCVPFEVSEDVRVRVKADVAEEDIVVCDAELYRGSEGSPAQRARITLIVTEEKAR